jgi:hypothetical protein
MMPKTEKKTRKEKRVKRKKRGKRRCSNLMHKLNINPKI